MSDSPSALLDVRRTPIHLTAAPGLVDLARAHVADGSITALETPALLRQIASQRLVVTATFAVAIEWPAPPRIPVTDGFVLVEYEVRPGVRNYRLAKVPANDPLRIRIGAFERHVHRTLVLVFRRLVSILATRVILPPESKVGLLGQRARAGG
jgi:hypothetical protein